MILSEPATPACIVIAGTYRQLGRLVQTKIWTRAAAQVEEWHSGAGLALFKDQ